MAEHVLDHLAAWRAGALASTDARRVEEHLAACAACAAEASADEALDEALARADVPLARGASDRVRASLADLGRPAGPTPVPWALVAGVAFTLGLAVAADLRAPA